MPQLTISLGVCAMAVTILSGVSAGQGKVPAIPSAPGVAVGTVVLGSTTVPLAHAYAMARTEFDETLYQIVLTDKPMPADALARELARGGQPLLKAGKLSGISLLVDTAGHVRNIVPYVGDLRGEKMLAGGRSLAAFSVKGTLLSGQAVFGTDRTVGQGWSFIGSWTATVLPSK
jgi:hypothetical protein